MKKIQKRRRERVGGGMRRGKDERWTNEEQVRMSERERMRDRAKEVKEREDRK